MLGKFTFIVGRLFHVVVYNLERLIAWAVNSSVCIILNILIQHLLRDISFAEGFKLSLIHNEWSMTQIFHHWVLNAGAWEIFDLPLILLVIYLFLASHSIWSYILVIDHLRHVSSHSFVTVWLRIIIRRSTCSSVSPGANTGTRYLHLLIGIGCSIRKWGITLVVNILCIHSFV